MIRELWAWTLVWWELWILVILFLIAIGWSATAIVRAIQGQTNAINHWGYKLSENLEKIRIHVYEINVGLTRARQSAIQYYVPTAAKLGTNDPRC